jgi:mRNA interferase MazF
MAVASQLGSALSSGDVPVRQWKEAGLLKESAVKPLFATIEQTIIARRLGTLQPSDLIALPMPIANIIG